MSLVEKTSTEYHWRFKTRYIIKLEEVLDTTEKIICEVCNKSFDSSKGMCIGETKLIFCSIPCMVKRIREIKGY